jgi:hypothetical protein
VTRVVSIEGAEKRAELAGDMSSDEDRDELERTEKRGWGCILKRGCVRGPSPVTRCVPSRVYE